MFTLVSRNYVSFLKVIGIALLFAPMWGLMWHNVNFNEMWNFTWASQRIKAATCGRPACQSCSLHSRLHLCPDWHLS